MDDANPLYVMGNHFPLPRSCMADPMQIHTMSPRKTWASWLNGWNRSGPNTWPTSERVSRGF